MSLTKIRLPLWELPKAILVQIITWLLNVLVTFRWCDFVFPAFLVAVDARWGWGGRVVMSGHLLGWLSMYLLSWLDEILQFILCLLFWVGWSGGVRPLGVLGVLLPSSSSCVGSLFCLS